MEHKNEGVCRFCLNTYSGSAISRHLMACKAKKEQDAAEAARAGKAYKIYHLKINSYNWYWLYIEMPGSSKLSDLDRFLRNIWLECCGHLSQFKIKETFYEDSSAPNELDSFFGKMPSKSLKTKLYQALNVKDKFEYEYDFGSTTYLEGRVLGIREGILKKGIRILARNNPYSFDCDECGKKATDICTECESYFCEACLESHECGDEMALPIVNSPRMGVCGYSGDGDFDNFTPDKAKSPGKK